MIADDELAALVRPDSVNKRVYTDPAIFALEMERIYGRAWIYVGHDSQVPNTGDYHTTRLGDQDVVLVRTADGAVKVLYNRCPHKGAKLVSEGDGCAGKFFRCPYHAWTFKLDGTHLGAPKSRSRPVPAAIRKRQARGGGLSDLRSAPNALRHLAVSGQPLADRG